MTIICKNSGPCSMAAVGSVSSADILEDLIPRPTSPSIGLSLRFQSTQIQARVSTLGFVVQVLDKCQL